MNRDFYNKLSVQHEITCRVFFFKKTENKRYKEKTAGGEV